MIAALTRAALLLQLLLLAGLAAALERFLLPGALLLSGVAAGLLLLLSRVAVLVNNFFLSGAVHQPMGTGQRASTFRLIASMLQECCWSLACWFWLFPSGRPFLHDVPGDTGLPVLLLHGYGANAGFWRPFSRRLSVAGVRHAAIDLEPVTGSIDAYAPLIDDAVGQLCASSGTHQVVLVCHSMGGLAARAWMRRYGSARVARVITLGTPHFGSTLAGYGIGINARQMLPSLGSATNTPDWLTQLGRDETNEQRALIMSIGSRHDNIVSPQRSAELPGARNVMLELVGHVALGFDRRVLDRVLEEITEARRSRSSAGS